MEKYDEAVRELRTHRRISGSNENIALIADAERGRGKPEKALELLEWAKEAELDNDTRTELVIVAAGAKSDLGDIDAARALIEAEDFTQRPSGALVRLMSAYAEVLRLHGETELADKYEELSRRTAKATGTLFGDEEPDPNFGVEIETIEEIPDEDLESADDADADSHADADDDADADFDSDGDAATYDIASNGNVSAGTASDEAPSTDEGTPNAGAGQAGSTDDESPTSTGEAASAESAADNSAAVAAEDVALAEDAAPAADPDEPAAAAPSSKTHVSEKELKKVKVSDDEIEAELDELLAEADDAEAGASDATDGDATADSAEAPTAGDEADATSADDTATDDTATDEPEGSDSANGDR
ncbi:hypothetical protein [Brevibacterium casei]